MHCLPNRLQQEAGLNPLEEMWMLSREPSERMSFRGLFDSVEGRRYIESLRPELPCPIIALPEISKANDFSLSASLLDGEETDEVTLTKRLRDYLLTIRYYPNVESIPLPGILLDEYLCALGPQEPSFWRKLPMATIFRVTEGELPISSTLSAQLSRVFGTHRRFWYDLQVEYDRCKSGTWDRLDSLEQSGFDEEEDFDT